MPDLKVVPFGVKSNYRRGLEDLRGKLQHWRGDLAQLAADAQVGYVTLIRFKNGTTKRPAGETVDGIVRAMGEEYEKLFGPEAQPVCQAPAPVHQLPPERMMSRRELGRILRRKQHRRVR